MKIGKRHNNVKLSLFVGVVTTLLSISLLVLLGRSLVYAAEIYSNELPFGTPYDIWIGKWWSWWITTTTQEATPKPDGCLMNKEGSMVMLMETAVPGRTTQNCEISSNQSIMVPLWTAWAEDSINQTPPRHNWSYAQLSKFARETYNLGAVTSLVSVDGQPLAKLDVVSLMQDNSLVYNVNSLENVTEIYSRGFNITIPEDTHFPDQNPGTWRAGAHGWFVFLKSLPPGHHTIYYNVNVRGAGANPHSAEITYDLTVK